MRNGVTHTEFIRSHADGEFYFLETAARVGGAYIAEVVELATGSIRGWSGRGSKLRRSTVRSIACRSSQRDFAGSVICLARQEEPDTSAYDGPGGGDAAAQAASCRADSCARSRCREWSSWSTNTRSRFAEDFLAIDAGAGQAHSLKRAAKSLLPEDGWKMDGESAGARTQDQRLKRAMLYQLSYALEPLYKLSTFSGVERPAGRSVVMRFRGTKTSRTTRCPGGSRRAENLVSTVQNLPRCGAGVTLKCHRPFIDLR